MKRVSNNERIAKNTFMLYVRMLFLMTVNLYISRVLLRVLGVEDFGIYNVVGGVVAMFSVISGSLSASISRFLTYELGKKNIDKLKRIFSTAIMIQIGISVIIILFAETIGVWFLNSEMNIPIYRIYAANWVFQFSIIAFIVNLVSLPYNALLIAHEKMAVFAYISILEAIGKLVGVYFLVISPIDKLVSYAMLVVVIAVLVRYIYSRYCKTHFKECTFQFLIDSSLLKSMCTFAGWNFFGSTSLVLKEQGVNVVLNIFCGPSINAARGIAVQVNNAVSAFIANFMTALEPQIIKSYADRDNRYMYFLIYQGTKLSFYLMLFLVLPILLNAEFVLELWLGKVPNYCTQFVRLMLVLSLLDCLYRPLLAAHLATGRIKELQLIVGGINLLNLPLSFWLLKCGYEPVCTVVISIILSIITLFLRVFLFSKLDDYFCIKDFVRNVVMKIMYVSFLSIILPIILSQLYPNSSVLMESTVCFLSVGSAVYYLGLSIDERRLVKQKICQIAKCLRCVFCIK